MTAHYQTFSLDEYIQRMGNTETITPIDAYENVAWFGAGIDVRRNAFTNMAFDLMKGDSVLGDNLSFEDLAPELNIFYVLDDMFTDLDLFGRAYCIYETNQFGLNARWRRFHPHSITPEYDFRGNLTHFTRRDKAQSARIELDNPNFIYLWMPSYRRENMPGVGVGHRGLVAASSLLNTGKFQNAFFDNGAVAPTLVRIKGYGQLDTDEQERTKNIFQRMLSGGLQKAFGIHPIDGDEVDVVPMMQQLKDMAMDALTKLQREEIATGLGIPQSLLIGNAANFATARVDNFNLYDKWVAPMAVNIIASQLNERHYVPRGAKLVYRKERMDVYQDAMLDKSSALVPLFDRGIINTNEIRPQLGFEPIDMPEADEFVVPERLLGSGSSSDSDEGQIDSLEGLEGLDAKAHFVGNEAYVTIGLANHPQLIGVQEQLKDLFTQDSEGAMVGDWQEPKSFHITLVYCFDIDNRQLHRATETFRFHGFNSFDMRVLGLSVFNNPDGQALHLAVQHTPLLDALQKRVWAEFSGVNTSEFSKPSSWQPHITMAYMPLGMPIPQIEDLEPFDLAVETIQFMRDDYQVFAEFSVDEVGQDPLVFELDNEVKLAIDDLDKWERMAIKRLKEGNPEKTADFSSDYIAPIQHSSLVGMLSAMDDVERVKAVFSEAKASAGEWVNYG